VRLDSGNFLELSRQVRGILDDAGLRETKIVLSGDLNEYKIEELLTHGAPIDMFGVGTEMVVSRDQPALGGVYKLVESRPAGTTRHHMKLSEDKVTLPGRKQVFRQGDGGRTVRDVLALEGEAPGGEPLLADALVEGRRAAAPAGLETIRRRVQEGLAALPEPYRRLVGPDTYPVLLGDGLQALVKRLRRERVR